MGLKYSWIKAHRCQNSRAPGSCALLGALGSPKSQEKLVLKRRYLLLLHSIFTMKAQKLKSGVIEIKMGVTVMWVTMTVTFDTR